MKIAGLILGIVGGIFGLGSTLMKLFAGGLAAMVDEVAGGAIILVALLTGIAALYGLIASCLTMSKPMFSGVSQVVVGAVCLLTASYTTGVIFLVGGILAIVAARQEATAAAASGSDTVESA